MIEPETKIISVFKLGDNKRYGRPDMYSESDQIKVGVLEELEIDLSLIFED